MLEFCRLIDPSELHCRLNDSDQRELACKPPVAVEMEARAKIVIAASLILFTGMRYIGNGAGAPWKFKQV